MKFTQIPTNTFQELQLNAGILTSNFTPATGTVESNTILGATSGVDESGQAGKDMRPLKKGDKVSIVYYAQSLEGDDEIQEMPDEEFNWKESYRFKEKDLPDGKYAFTYEVTDITGKSTMSDVAFLNLKNGEIKPEL